MRYIFNHRVNLDLLINRNDNSNLTIISVLPSDHNAVICRLNFPAPAPSTIETMCRQITLINKATWNNDIYDFLQTHHQSDDVNTFTNSMDTCNTPKNTEHCCESDITNQTIRTYSTNTNPPQSSLATNKATNCLQDTCHHLQSTKWCSVV